ncbi:transposable element Tcb2 transposase [Trichonephila clavipes]|nr:transposable element Tcb2 transposase [Trichonephila clavipes]
MPLKSQIMRFVAKSLRVAEQCDLIFTHVTEDPPFLGGQCMLYLSNLKRPSFGVVWKLGEGGYSSVVVFVTCPWFKITSTVANSPRFALECDLEVSKELGISQSVISRLWQRFQDDGNISRRCSTGHPRVTTLNQDQYLAVTIKGNRRSAASDLSRQLSSVTGTTFSRQTVYRRLGKIGVYAWRPVRCVPLTATLCLLLLAWSGEHAI